MKQLILTIILMCVGCTQRDRNIFCVAGATQEERSIIQDAMYEWQTDLEVVDVACNSIITITDTKDENFDEDDLGYIYISNETKFSSVVILRQGNADKLRRIVLHEIGHHLAISADHLGPGNVMAEFYGQQSSTLTNEDFQYGGVE